MDPVKAVDIKNLSYRYPDGSVALENINLEIFKDERIGLVGANGAGKSTLLLHLNGILKGSGDVLIFGTRVEERNFREIRKRVGLVFQNPDDQLFTPTIFEDVAFGLRNMRLPDDEVEMRVKNALDSVGLGDRDYKKKSAFHMSFGEKKRASIATVLAMEPDIVALDEPTSNLDPRGRREIIELLEKLGGTQIVVTHDLDLVKSLCDRVMVMNGGRVVASGLVDEILTNGILLSDNGLT
jgi:cobalt/nickel transport system ATP-binding protein